MNFKAYGINHVVARCRRRSNLTLFRGSAFLKKNAGLSKGESIKDVFSKVMKSPNKDEFDKKTMRQYVTKNMSLGNEIATYIDGAIEIIRKGDYSDHKIAKFDKLQNKVIKKMKRNYFFELGLQRELYMLQSGLGADRSLEGQLAFHLDFLSSAKAFNGKFRKALKEQFRLLTSH